MKTTGQAIIYADLLSTKTAVGEVAKLGLTWGFNVNLRPSEEMEGTMQATLQQHTPVWLHDEIAAAVALECVVRDLSVEEVLETVKGSLRRRGHPMEGKPSDRPGLGEAGTVGRV